VQILASVPVAIAYSTDTSVCGKGQQQLRALLVLRESQRHAYEPEGQQHQQTLHLFRARRRHAFVQGVVTYSAAVSVGENGPAASAGLTSLACDAAPCLRA